MVTRQSYKIKWLLIKATYIVYFGKLWFLPDLFVFDLFFFKSYSQKSKTFDSKKIVDDTIGSF